MTKQVLVFFSIGRYINEIRCDVLMYASHILLGRLCQYNKCVGYKNCYSFSMNDQNLIPALLSSKKVLKG